MTLPVRTRDRLTIDLDPYVLPLEQMLERQRRVLVVEVSHEDARFRVHCLGRQDEIDRCRSFVPSVTVDRSRPGTVQRHRLTHFQWHLRGVAQATSRLLQEQQCDAVVLAGDETVLGTLEELLPRDVEQRLIGSFHPDPEQARTRAYWEREVEEILARRRTEEEEEALSALPDAEARGLLVSGMSAVLDAVNVFVVRRLLIADGAGQPGWVCREHHFASLEGGRCPFCDRELMPVDDVVDELVEIARLHGVELMLVERARDLLAAYEGIAAVTYPHG
jgi:peptide subunit release factor 1 (eRF1)